MLILNVGFIGGRRRKKFVEFWRLSGRVRAHNEPSVFVLLGCGLANTEDPKRFSNLSKIKYFQMEQVETAVIVLFI